MKPLSLRTQGRFGWKVLLRIGILSVTTTWACAQEWPAFSGPIECEGSYPAHLQGVARDQDGQLFWSFTTRLVKTDLQGTRTGEVEVANHHGDLCFVDGRIYVAVNLGKFNDPEGNADCWIYVYDAATLEEVAKHPVPEVFHGAGGIDFREGRFFVVGGLPEGVPENFVYEYDGNFHFVKRHVVASGWTLLGIQTALWHDNSWWFGCYGKPAELLKTGADFKMVGRFEFSCALGIVGVDSGKFLVAEGSRTEEGRHRGKLYPAIPDDSSGLKRSLPQP